MISGLYFWGQKLIIFEDFWLKFQELLLNDYFPLLINIKIKILKNVFELF